MLTYMRLQRQVGLRTQTLIYAVHIMHTLLLPNEIMGKTLI